MSKLPIFLNDQSESTATGAYKNLRLFINRTLAQPTQSFAVLRPFFGVSNRPHYTLPQRVISWNMPGILKNNGRRIRQFSLREYARRVNRRCHSFGERHANDIAPTSVEYYNDMIQRRYHCRALAADKDHKRMERSRDRATFRSIGMFTAPVHPHQVFPYAFTTETFDTTVANIALCLEWTTARDLRFIAEGIVIQPRRRRRRPGR